ncbi:ImmA/IrrE family metallo-endopeptidase [Enterococcus faecalis]|uniref:ImmA/IrrE family metallo-endopeptidase n=1 Tax=Enterococcus faecalis TaxID=1351 RepID=UPI0029C791DA|nr:ImmA/IrrE family metallo-endopeptidase [Enterococcus faecalis]WPH44423.1 ImmA/IrrE family metallo-endopeptidase [Enterococcus faecalis]
MNLPSIDKKVKQLVKTYETRNPYKIANNLGIIVIEEDLGEIMGFYNKLKKIKMIHINSSLTEREKIVTCSHELGHSLLHPDENTPMLSEDTIVSELKIEKEANYFATILAIDESHRDYGLSCRYEILQYYGLPDSFDRFL